MFKKDSLSFIFWWESLRRKGKKNYIIKNHIIKSIIIFSLIYIISSLLYKRYKGNVSLKFLIFSYIIGFIFTGIISAFFSKYLWKYNNKKFLKLNLKNIAETYGKIDIIEKIK